jgi:hypothetical protein
MLRKLLKHEFRATGRIMLPMYLVLLATAVGSNLSGRWMIDSRFSAVSILGVLIVTAFGFAIFGVLLMSFVLMIQRFYKNLLQDEGYLMFTLPVSVHQHIWSKLIVSAVWFITTVLAVIGASLIVAYQEGFLREMLDFLRYFFQGLQKLKITEALNGTVYLVELFILVFLAMAAFSLQFYAALAAGHSQPNHKMLWSVGCFFGFQAVLQFSGTMLLIGLTRLDLFRYLKFDWDPTPAVAIHVGLLMSIGCVVIYGAIFYAVTTFFLKRHLNLE